MPAVVASLRLQRLGPIVLEPGQSKIVTLKVERRNCPGPIKVKLDGTPAGVTASNGLVGDDAAEGRMTVAVARDTTPGSHTLRLLAIAPTARTDGELPDHRRFPTRERTSQQHRHEAGADTWGRVHDGIA